MLTDRRAAQRMAVLMRRLAASELRLGASGFLSELALDGAIITANWGKGSFGSGGAADRCSPQGGRHGKQRI
jgi:hypothetical protein